MANIATPPKLQFFATDGSPLSGGKVYTYAAGTTTPLATYTDASGSTPNTNPVILNSRGEASIWFSAVQYKLTLKTADNVDIWTVDNLNGADTATINSVLATLAASGGAGRIGYAGGGAGAQTTTVQAVLRNYVHVEQYGAVGNNMTDDYTAIASAAAEAAAQGATLIFDGTKTYKINQDTLTFPAGLSVQFNGATLSFSKTQGSSTNPMIVITGPFSADWVRVAVPSGIVRNYGVSTTGSNVAIDKITVTSVDQQAQLAAAGDYAVQIGAGDRIQIGTISVTNFDRAVIITTTTNSYIGGCDVISYVRGVWVEDNTYLFVGKSHIRTRSPNASQTAGHNSVLTTTTAVTQTNITLSDFVCEDAGEHSIRIGGSPQINFYLVRPRISNAQGCGIKILGMDNNAPDPTKYNQNLVIDSPIIEDCGTGGGAATNMCGILLERSEFCEIINPIIRPRVQTSACYYGIQLFGVSYVNITNPRIEGCSFGGVYLLTEKSGAASADVSDVNIIGGMIRDNPSRGLYIIASDSKTIRQVNITGVRLSTNGIGAAIATYTSGTFVSCFLNAQFYANTDTSIISTSTAWMLDCFGLESYGTSPTSFASINATNSSRWSNNTSLYVLKAGTWTAV